MASRLLIERNATTIKHVRQLMTVQQKKFYSVETVPQQSQSDSRSFNEKLKDAWNGPNFKYWFIGATGFISWLSYYGFKAYKKKCITVEILPALPNHATVKREEELSDLFSIYHSQCSLLEFDTVKKLLISGPSSSGKTTLASQFKNAIQHSQASAYTLPKSNVVAFLQAENENAFLSGLKAFAAKLEIRLSDIDETLAEADFHSASFEKKCSALTECIQEKLKKHPGWMIFFDQVQSTTPKSVVSQINQLFLNDPTWSSGTVIVLADSVKGIALSKDNTYTMKSMSLRDSSHLVLDIVNMDEKYVSKEALVSLTEKVHFNPLGLTCVALLLKQKLLQNELASIGNTVEELCAEIDENVKKVLDKNQHMEMFTSTMSGLRLLTLKTVVAMALKMTVDNNAYLKHGFDFMATLTPGCPVPTNLISRHLTASFYMLPSLVKPSSSLDFMSKQKRDAEAVKENADEFDPKGKAWSNKNLAHYIRNVEDFFETSYNTVKDIYNLVYGELPPLPEKDDGLEMFRKCELLQSSTIEPGGVKGISMHPLVYNVARQRFLSSTAAAEASHLKKSELLYHNQSWYRRIISGFSEQACLQQYRNTAANLISTKDMTEKTAELFLFRYNLGIDVSGVLSDGVFSNKTESFWQPTAVEQFRYLQDHVSRTINSLCDQIHVTKDDLAGKSVKKSALDHLEYILQNHPLELIGRVKHVDVLTTMANCYTSLYKDTQTSKKLLDHVLQLQQPLLESNPLDVAKTLAELAQHHNSHGEYEEARALLERTCDMYDADRKKFGEYRRPVEYGKMLGILGVVYGSLNMKVESKETIERALMLQQSVPPDTTDEEKSKKFGCEFASTLIDLGHSYISLGLPLYGKKILDLALAAQKNLNGDNHPEVVRAMTVLAIAHLLQGHNEESKKLRREAGKIQANINKLPLY